MAVIEQEQSRSSGGQYRFEAIVIGDIVTPEGPQWVNRGYSHTGDPVVDPALQKGLAALSSPQEHESRVSLGLDLYLSAVALENQRPRLL